MTQWRQKSLFNRQSLQSCSGRNICSDIILAGGSSGDGLVVLATHHLVIFPDLKKVIGDKKVTYF